MRAWAFAGLAWPSGRAWGLDCGLSPKTRPAQAQAFGLFSKNPSPNVRLGPGPNPVLLLSCFVKVFASKKGYEKLLESLLYFLCTK
jgi:hypothetical protein